MRLLLAMVNITINDQYFIDMLDFERLPGRDH